jgi:hypothetical protein
MEYREDYRTCRSEQAESNHKIVNEIYWRSWVHNIFEFSPSDSSYLLSVAEQHPHQGGTAVYDARVMLGLDFYDYDEGNQQKSFNVEEDSEFSENEQIEFLLYPNPTSDFINYSVVLDESELADLTFYDLLGRPVSTIKLTSERAKGIFYVTELSKGMYTFKIIISNGKSTSGSFVIN